MNIINLTPHILNVLDESGKQVAEIQPSGSMARIKTTRTLVDIVDGIQLYKTDFGEPEGLPEARPDTIYVVSGMFRAAVPDRLDVFQPGELVRDTSGRPIGCKGLTR